AGVRLDQRCRPLLIGIDCRLVGASLLEGLEAGLAHEPRSHEILHAPNVLGAPNAARLAGREADGVADVIHSPAHAIDPAETHRRLDRLGPGDARLARPRLVEPDEQLWLARVMAAQPIAEVCRSLEKAGFRGHVRGNEITGT